MDGPNYHGGNFEALKLLGDLLNFELDLVHLGGEDRHLIERPHKASLADSGHFLPTGVSNNDPLVWFRRHKALLPEGQEVQRNFVRKQELSHRGDPAYQVKYDTHIFS